MWWLNQHGTLSVQQIPAGFSWRCAVWWIQGQIWHHIIQGSLCPRPYYLSYKSKYIKGSCIADTDSKVKHFDPFVWDKMKQTTVCPVQSSKLFNIIQKVHLQVHLHAHDNQLYLSISMHAVCCMLIWSEDSACYILCGRVYCCNTTVDEIW